MYIYFRLFRLKILLFYKKILKIKSPSAKCQRAGNCQALPIGNVWNFLLG